MRFDIVAHKLHENKEPWFKISKCSPKREWVDQTQQKFGYRCLPLTMTNQYGWNILCPSAFSAIWNGTNDYDSIKIKYDDPVSNQYNFASSHFGNGVMTMNFDYIFRTSPDVDIYVKGPANNPKDGIHALEGIIETDWLPFTFTMNWKFTRPFKEVRFELNEPIATFFPVQRGFLEQFHTKFVSINESPEFAELYKEYSVKRTNFNNGQFNDDDEKENGWQKFYFQGKDASGCKHIDNHKSNVRVMDFTLGSLNGEENLLDLKKKI